MLGSSDEKEERWSTDFFVELHHLTTVCVHKATASLYLIQITKCLRFELTQRRCKINFTQKSWTPLNM